MNLHLVEILVLKFISSRCPLKLPTPDPSSLKCNFGFRSGTSFPIVCSLCFLFPSSSNFPAFFFFFGNCYLSPLVFDFLNDDPLLWCCGWAVWSQINIWNPSPGKKLATPWRVTCICSGCISGGWFDFLNSFLIFCAIRRQMTTWVSHSSGCLKVKYSLWLLEACL